MDQHIVVMQINSNVFSEHKLINPNDKFDNVVWSDETTVQLEIHRRFCYRKDGEKPRPKPCPKHPIKVHGISKKGATTVCIFEGIMAAPLYCKILKRALLPQKFPPPCTHRYIQDNDPKHTSRPAQNFYSQSGINWWCNSSRITSFKSY